jgi:hypothetical protein
MINLSESWELIPGRQIRGEERPVQAHHSRNISPIDFPGRCGLLLPGRATAEYQGLRAVLGIAHLDLLQETDTRDYVIFLFRIVSRDGYFFESLNILISAFCVCADGFQGLSTAFHFLIQLFTFN